MPSLLDTVQRVPSSRPTDLGNLLAPHLRLADPDSPLVGLEPAALAIAVAVTSTSSNSSCALSMSVRPLPSSEIPPDARQSLEYAVNSTVGGLDAASAGLPTV